MKYYIAHNNNDIIHYDQVEHGQVFSSGQEFIEEFDNFDDWTDRLTVLGIDVSEIEKIEPVKVLEVTRVKFFLALNFYQWNGDSLGNHVSAIMDQLPEPAKTVAQIRMDQATVFKREDAMLNQAASILGMTESDLDDFFRYAEREEWNG